MMTDTILRLAATCHNFDLDFSKSWAILNFKSFEQSTSMHYLEIFMGEKSVILRNQSVRWSGGKCSIKWIWFWLGKNGRAWPRTRKSTLKRPKLLPLDPFLAQEKWFCPPGHCFHPKCLEPIRFKTYRS